MRLSCAYTVHFLAGHDSIRHLKGTSLFFPAEERGESSQLRQAVFWIHLDQEIYNAYIHQRSVRTDFSLRDIESYTEDKGDDMWVHKILYITAFVSKWAFGEDPSQSRWRELCRMVDDWEEKRPLSFDALYFRNRNPQQGRFFAEVCYATDEAIYASHIFYMAKLLLATHDPSIPRIGPRVKFAVTAMQETALSYVRTMVGSAVCNNYVPARFTASLAVIICKCPLSFVNWSIECRKAYSLKHVQALAGSRTAENSKLFSNSCEAPTNVVVGQESMHSKL